MAICDATYNFLHVDIGDFGHHNDASVFGNSNMGTSLHNRTFGLPPQRKLPGSNTVVNHCIVGDAAFLLNTYLMKPYPGSQLPDPESKFNYRYCNKISHDNIPLSHYSK